MSACVLCAIHGVTICGLSAVFCACCVCVLVCVCVLLCARVLGVCSIVCCVVLSVCRCVVCVLCVLFVRYCVILSGVRVCFVMFVYACCV